MLECKECGRNCKNFVSLAQHVTRSHGMSTEEYFLRYSTRTLCVVCGSSTKFINLSQGYRLTCSVKCACAFNKMNLRNDPDKFQKFSERVSNNMIRIWATRDNVDIRKKIGETIKDNLSGMTDEERRAKYGKNKVGYAKSLLDYWMNATEEQKRETRLKSATTIINFSDERKMEIALKQRKTFSERFNFHVTEEQIRRDEIWYQNNAERILEIFGEKEVS